MDAFGHVNNGVYLTYFETARIEYFIALGLPGWVTPEGTGPIVHSTSARYRIPVTYPDVLHVGARLKGELSSDRFTMAFSAWSKAHDAVAADGECVVVVFDYRTREKARVDDVLRAAIARVEGKK